MVRLLDLYRGKYRGAGAEFPRLTLGRISFRIHGLFWLILIGSVLTGRFIEIITLFGIVFIHEWGHVAMAKSFGWQVREVELLPFGGVARFDEVPESWRQEVCVILAGPLSNGLMIPFSLLFGRMGWWPPAWVDYFVLANGLIAGFNLLPFPPLDGGRLLKVLAARFSSYLQVLKHSAITGFFGAGCLGGFALFGWRTGAVHLNLLLIACFLAVHNFQEWRLIPFHFLRFLLRRQRYPERTRRYPPLMLPVMAHWRLRQAAELMRWERYHLFVRPPGRIIREEELVQNYLDGHGSRTIQDVIP